MNRKHPTKSRHHAFLQHSKKNERWRGQFIMKKVGDILMQKVLLRLFIVPLLIISMGHGLSAQSFDQAPVQWHFDGDKVMNISGNSVHGVDWVFRMIATDKGEFIACGYSGGGATGYNWQPSIFKLDGSGRLVWSKVINNISSNGYASTGTNKQGLFRDIIKTPNGYAAIGYIYDDAPGGACTSSAAKILLVELDDNGNLLSNSILFHTGSSCDSRGQTIAIDPSGDYFFVAAGSSILKINYTPNNRTIVATYSSFTPGPHVSGFTKILTRPNGIDYDVIACGAKSMYGSSGTYDDNTLQHHPTNPAYENKDGAHPNLYQYNKDIWFVRLDKNLSSVLVNVNYAKSDLNPLNYTDYGPCTATRLETHGGSSPIIANFMKESVNHYERADDMILTNDGNLAIAAQVNRIAIWGFAGEQDFNTNIYQNVVNGIKLTDPVSQLKYQLYTDADGYILKIDPSDGSIIWNRNIGHFSSREFTLGLTQIACGDFIIAGSSADYGKGLSQYGALVVATEDNANPANPRKWARYLVDENETNVCIFTVDKTLDGGFVIGGDYHIGGDNPGNHDDYSITKFAPPSVAEDAVSAAYDIRGYYAVGLVGSSTVTWNTNMRVAARVTVPAGKTLIIDNCTISFASTDQLYDYWVNKYFPDAFSGIVVEPGGHLVIRNGAVLKGLSICDNEQMWDGIIVEGDPYENQTGNYQGRIDVTNSTIKNARCGISIHEAFRETKQLHTNQTNTNFDDVVSNTWGTRYVATYNKGGGILAMSQSNVENCRFGVRIFAYPAPGSGKKANSPCTISESNFKCDAYMLDRYLYSGNDHRRWGQNSHFTANLIDGIRLYDNIFEIDPNLFDWDIRGNGIAAWDAGIKIEKGCYSQSYPCSNYGPGNKFNNLGQGIYAAFTPTQKSLPFFIRGSEFNNNQTGTFIANSENGLSIQDNKYNLPSLGLFSSAGNQLGVNIVASTGYDISYNSFDVINQTGFGLIGICVKNGHNKENLVHNNRFNRLGFGCLALQRNGNTNTGLQFKCNDFESDAPNPWGSGNLNMLDITRLSHDLSFSGNIVGGSLRLDQGYCSFQHLVDYYSAPAGNRFLNGCNGGNDNRLAADYDAEQAQVVNYHNNEANTSFDPNPCYNSSGYFNNACNTGVDDDTRYLACGVRPGDGAALAELVSRLQDLSQEESYDDLRKGLETEIYLTVSDIARNYGQQGYYDSAAVLLESYERYSEAISFYLQAEMYTEAIAARDHLSEETDEEQRYALLIDSAINLYSNGRTWFDLDSAGKQMIVGMTENNDPTGYMAMAIAELLELKSLSMPVPELPHPAPVDKKGRGENILPSVMSQTVPGRDSEWSFYPNPSSGEINIQSSYDGTFVIYNIQGIEVLKRHISAGITNFHLPNDFPNGMYIGKIIGDKSNQASVRFLYQR